MGFLWEHEWWPFHCWKNAHALGVQEGSALQLSEIVFEQAWECFQSCCSCVSSPRVGKVRCAAGCTDCTHTPGRVLPQGLCCCCPSVTQLQSSLLFVTLSLHAAARGTLNRVFQAGTSMASFRGQTRSMMKLSNATEMHWNGTKTICKSWETFLCYRSKWGIWKGTGWVCILHLVIICSTGGRWINDT